MLKRITPKNIKQIREHNKQLDEMYHCCRWCHYYDNGYCLNSNVIENYKDYSSDYMYKVSEEGHLSEVLTESFHSVKKNGVTENVVKKLRGYNLSEKKIKEVYDLLINSIDEWFDNEVKVRLDSDVSRLYNNVGCEIEGVVIQNPEEYCCKEFM